jgi:hypothetical protein
MGTQLTFALFDYIEPAQQKIPFNGIPENEPLKVLYGSLAGLPGIFSADFRSRY